MTLEIDDSVRQLNLAAPKATQLFNHANHLIEALERRNEWVLCVIGFFPDLPEILHPQISTWHCFKKVRHHFMLRHVWQRDVWRLSVANAPRDHKPPPAAKTGRRPTRQRQRADENGARAANVRRPPRKTKKRVAEWVGRAVAMLEATPELYRIVDNVVALATQAFAFARQKVAAIQSAAEAFFTFAQPSGDMSAPAAEYPVQESSDHARYEKRVFKVGHMVFELTVLERIRWEDWLFGRLIEEEELQLA